MIKMVTVSTVTFKAKQTLRRHHIFYQIHFLKAKPVEILMLSVKLAIIES